MQSEPHMVQGGARGIFEARRGAPPVKADGVLPGVNGSLVGRIFANESGTAEAWLSSLG